jgi:two-component system chemotaxis sensor kinase CheA
MFISSKRHEREIQELRGAGTRLSEAILNNVSQGIFFLDADDNVLQPISQSLTTLLRRRHFGQSKFEKLLRPVVSEKTLMAICARLSEMRAANARGEVAAANPLHEVEVRLLKPDGSFDSVQYDFEFFPVELPDHPDAWMVRVTDRSAQVQQIRELEDLRTKMQIQSEILQSLLQTGRNRFAASVQRAGAAMRAINSLLKKPAREESAFRGKLEETQQQVDKIRSEANVLRLRGMENAARLFENSLQELRSRPRLSGNDFLPLAVQLDELFSQFTLLRSITQSAAPSKSAAKDKSRVQRGSSGAQSEGSDAQREGSGDQTDSASETTNRQAATRVTANGTQILESPQFPEDAADRATNAAKLSTPHHAAPVGTLEGTLAAMTEHVAFENGKRVALECRGLEKVPSAYQGTVKNVSIQFIRNAVIHGIEPAAEREHVGKPAQGTLKLNFAALPDGNFELRFSDDGRGVDPELVRLTAIAQHLIKPEIAERLHDRQAIKLIFQDGFTTLQSGPTDTPRGTGLSLVRRYVQDAGGKVALASHFGTETRFKVSLPPVARTRKGSPRAPDEAQVA